MSLFLILLAAGDSKRLRSNTPKPFHKINNKRLIEHSIASFNEFQEIKKTVIVYNRKHKKFLDKIKLKNTIKVKGGRSRQESTFNALKKIRKMNCTKILIHDAARPNPSKLLIKNLINKIKKKHAVIPIIKINDATKRVKKDVIFKNIQRGSLRFAQTPQGYTYKKIYEMHKKNHNLIFDDDSAMFTNEGINVTTIKGSKKNLKITDKEDLDVFKSLKKGKVYTGIGFDIHRLTKNRKLYLGGVKIPFKLGLKGHSDGDPVLHALIDSLLGACRLGDIGKFFSNTNKKYKNIRSTILLSKVVNLINSKNFLINNVDINIITQKPKMKKYIKKIIKTLSKLLDINSNQINIKAKTTEKLGLIGKEKAIASEVISSVIIYD